MDIQALILSRLPLDGIDEDQRAISIGQAPAEILEGPPDWWAPNGNRLFAAPGVAPINLIVHPGLPPPTNAVVIVCSGCTPPASIMLWGDQSLVFVGPNCYLPGGALHCGDGASIVIEDGNTCTYAPDLNARNGGLIWAAPDGLWSTGVRFLTDDMHAILDVETGRRVNTFGGHIRIERHVWLGMEAMLLPGAFIGHDCIIGARAVVSGHLPSHSICVGAPARAIRSGVTWSRDDTPPD